MFLIVTLTNHATEAEPPLIISVIFTVDSNTSGILPSTEEVCLWDTTKSHHEFLAEMRKKMRLDEDAALGYKFSADRQKDPVRKLSTAEDYKLAMEELKQKIRSARTRQHKLVLQNLVNISPTFQSKPRPERLRLFTQHPKQPTVTPKRKFDDQRDPTEAELTDSYFKQLQQKHFCKTHRRFCYIRRGVVPAHEEIDEMALGYWA